MALALAIPALALGVRGACGIEPVVSERLREANGLSLKRDVSELQAVTPAATNTSTAARGKIRERKISVTPHIAPYSHGDTGVELMPCGLIRL